MGFLHQDNEVEGLPCGASLHDNQLGDGMFEVDTKNVDLNAFIQGESPKHKESAYFIWIGVLYDNSPRKNEMQKDSDG